MAEIIIHIRGEDSPRKFSQSPEEVKAILDKKFAQIRNFAATASGDINTVIDSANNAITDPENRKVFGNLILKSNPIDQVRQKVKSFMEHTPYPNPLEGGIDISAGDIANIGMDIAPGTGDVIAASEFKQALQEGNLGHAALSGAGMLPMIPSLGGMVSKNTPDVLRLYHGGNVSKIDDSGTFGGIFASPDIDAAASHGAVHHMDIPGKDILTTSQMEYDLPYDRTKEILERNLGEMSEDELDEVYDAVVGDKGLYRLSVDDPVKEERLLEIFGESDLASAVWKGQKIRGDIAKEFGYKAVEMSDEHGSSYLVLPGVDVFKGE